LLKIRSVACVQTVRVNLQNGLQDFEKRYPRLAESEL